MRNLPFLRSAGKRVVQPFGFSFLLLLSAGLFSLDAAAKSSRHPTDTTVEKKVDYLERIYFSGEGKAGLNTKILVALQEMEGKQPTPALAKQVTFLMEIKDKAGAAGSACDILELLAVGIFNIDAAEGEMQGVKMPSDKAKADAADALSSLNQLSSASGSISNSASNLAWQSYLLNGGRYSGFGAGMSRLGNTTSAISGLAGTAGQTADAVKGFKGLFGNKDKGCKDVAKKEIQMGNHAGLNQLPVNAGGGSSAPVPAGAQLSAVLTTTVITINKVSNSLLRELTEAIRSKEGVADAEKTFDPEVSTITVNHMGKSDRLSDWIEDKFTGKFKLVKGESGKILLAVK